MKKTIFSILALGISLLCFAETTPINARLTEATVFFRGAELTHNARATLTRGENEVIIEGLSPHIDRNSLRIRTSQGTLVSMHEFSTDSLHASRQPSVRLTEMRDSLQMLQRQLEAVEIDINTTTGLSSILERGINKNVEGSESGLSIEELIRTMNYFDTKNRELRTARNTNDRRRTELRNEIRTLQTRINRERNEHSRQTGKLTMQVSSATGGASDFVITYFTPRASWTPFYNINVQSIDAPVQIISKARVQQTSGFDWDRVRLTLSTSTPNNNRVAPSLTTWFLREIQPIRPVTTSQEQLLQGRAAGISIASDEMAMEVMDIAPPAAQMRDRTTIDEHISVGESGLNLTFAIDLPFSIPSGAREQNVALRTQTAEAEFKYFSVPRRTTEVFLMAEIPNWQNLNLLGGQANVTFDGGFVGTTRIDANSTVEKLPLTLGTDRRVSVTRERMADFSATRTFGNDIRQTFAYRITVRNNQNRPIRITLQDQYPVSTLRDVRVELLRETTAWTTHAEDTGIITWEVELQPGETQVFQIAYSVRHPMNMRLNF